MDWFLYDNGLRHERVNIHGSSDYRGRRKLYLTPLYHFNPFHEHLDISRAITLESTPQHVASNQIWARNFWFPSASHKPLS